MVSEIVHMYSIPTVFIVLTIHVIDFIILGSNTNITYSHRMMSLYTLHDLLLYINRLRARNTFDFQILPSLTFPMIYRLFVFVFRFF